MRKRSHRVACFTILDVARRNLPRQQTASDWLRDSLRHRGWRGSLRFYGRELVDLLRDLTPERRRSRYGEVDFDFEHHVDTTWANVSLRTRFREWLSGGQYQPSEPELFRKMLEGLPVAAEGFTFVDLGSGKGRTLLLASDYPFRRIVGIELLDELNRIAVQNIAHYRSDRQKCFAIESYAGDARDFEFPAEPMVLYLFNPFPRHVWREVLIKLQHSLMTNPRRAYLIYHNPVQEDILAAQRWLREIQRTHQYVVYEGSCEGASP